MTAKKLQLFQNYESVYGMILARIIPVKITKELESVIAEPHRHDCYSIMIVETGEAKLKIDFQDTIMSPYSLLLIRPGQVHQTYLSKDLKGWILLFDAKIIDPHARYMIESSLQNIFEIKLKKPSLMLFNTILEAISEGLSETSQSKSHSLFLRKLLDALLFRITDLNLVIEKTFINKQPSRAVEITRTFTRLVKENFRTLKKPSEYASELSISVSYLNDTLRFVTGFTSSYIIQQEVMTEAQRLLFYTSMSIKEIAFELGYHDCKYFTRQFKVITQVTPSKFKKQNVISS